MALLRLWKEQLQQGATKAVPGMQGYEYTKRGRLSTARWSLYVTFQREVTMARRVFISFQHDDRMKAKGFNLLRWNKNVDLQFVGRHLLDPIDSSNRDYIRARIKEELAGTSVTVVLIGRGTAESSWVADEIRWSQEKGNGLLGICVDDGCRVPDALSDAGAEVIGWNPHAFEEAIERAATAAGRVPAIVASIGRSGGSCAR